MEVLFVLNIKQCLKDILYKLGLIADYVVETGTSGIWAYRKWNSGIAECWTPERVSTGGAQGSGASFMGGYWFYTGVNLPFAFISYPMATVDGNLGTGLGWSCCRTDSTSIQVHIIGNQNSSTMNFYIHAIGKWK